MFVKEDFGKYLKEPYSIMLCKVTGDTDYQVAGDNADLSKEIIRAVTHRKKPLTEKNSKGIIELMKVVNEKINDYKKVQREIAKAMYNNSASI